MISILARVVSSRSGDALGEVLPLLGVLFVVVMLGVVALVLGRRIVNKASSSEGDAFTLHDLRLLHQRGALTDEEFARAKAAIIGHVTASGGTGRSDTEADTDADNQDGERSGPDEKPTSR